MPLSLPAARFRWPGDDSEYFDSRLLAIGLLVSTIIVSVGLAYVLVNISPVLALVGVLAIPTGLLLVTRPDLGLLLIVFAIPLEDFNKFGGGISALKLLSIVVFGGMVVHFLIFRRKDSLVGAPQNWLISFFVLAVILSGFVAIDIFRTLDRTIKLLRVLSLYLVVINVVQSKRDLNRLLWAFLLGGFLSALYGILDPAQQGTRFVGTLGQTNLFAVSMVPRLPLALCLLSVEKGRLKQILLLVILSVIAYALTLTGSRGGLLATGLALILFALVQENKAVWLIMIGLIALGGLIAMPLEMKQRIGLVSSSSGQDLGNSTDRRETYQIYGWQLWQQHPILGIGLDGFTEAYTHSDYRFLQKNRTKRVAHNTYLEIAVGTGLLGLIPFISLFALSLFKTWKYSGFRNRYPYLASISAGLFAAQGGYFLGILFGSRQYEKTLWLLIALVVVIQNIATMAQRRRSADIVNKQQQVIQTSVK